MQDSMPVALYLRKLNAAQQNHRVGEKELLSIVEPLKRFGQDSNNVIWLLKHLCFFLITGIIHSISYKCNVFYVGDVKDYNVHLQ
jgi:hypothetical protein